jgi:hypothetical protein
MSVKNGRLAATTNPEAHKAKRYAALNLGTSLRHMAKPHAIAVLCQSEVTKISAAD